jgi:hypothetical protein
MFAMLQRIGAICLVAGFSATGSLASATGGITGFGATDAAWNRAHVADHTYAPGAAYDPDPSLPKVNGRVADRYYAVMHEEGHVLGYSERFRPQPISQAKALLLREFPPDAQTVWFRAVGASCAQMLVRSRTLGRALGTKRIGDPQGAALIEFSSGAAADHYNPRSVNDAFLLLYALVGKTGAPGC